MAKKLWESLTLWSKMYTILSGKSSSLAQSLMILTTQGQCLATSSWGIHVPPVPKIGQVKGAGYKSNPWSGTANSLSETILAYVWISNLPKINLNSSNIRALGVNDLKKHLKTWVMISRTLVSSLVRTSVKNEGNRCGLHATLKCQDPKSIMR